MLPGLSRPSWCGTVVSGGPPVLPPDTPHPIPTPDLHTLMCIGVENDSQMDVALVEPESSTVIQACSGMAASESVPTAPWSLEIRISGGGSAPLATFGSALLTGDPPYLIEVHVGADLNVTIRQRDSLPEDMARRYC